MPAVWAMGEPVLPLAVPGAAVSPGTSNCSFTNEPALTVIAELVLAVFVPSLTSLAVTVRVPEVFKVTLKLCVPFTRAALGGKAAFPSVEVMATVSLVLTTFQLASTALTVTVKAVPAACGEGVPVLPLAVPGAAVSPGAKICNLANAPALTTTLLEVAF